MPGQTLVERWSRWAPRLRSVLRISAAFVFIQYGTMKLFAFPGPLVPGGGTVPLASLAGVAGVLEVVGGTLLLLGAFTRPVA
ncbi:MAG TPA: DoxX family protein, partial [Myxococcaceae bacterium]|nr:DoxX family protein [Myxococcaceae bacterium]